MTGEGYHIVVAKVTSLEDEKNLGRIQVEFHNLGKVRSGWCPMVSPMAGDGRGFVFRPEVGDHVLVATLFGDVNQGFILGGIHSASQKQPAGDGKPADNNLRYIQSRSGHRIVLDDTKGKERIEVVDRDGTRRVVIDTGNKKIRVICDSGDVEVEAGDGNVSVKGGKAVTLEGQSVTVKAAADLTVQAGGTLTLKGATVNIN